jgi:ketosteroid isomerase-like protein
MGSSDESRDVATRFMQAMSKGDAETAISLLDEEVSWWLSRGIAEKLAAKGGNRWPESGQLEGRDTLVAELLGPVLGLFEPGSMRYDVGPIIADGEHAAVLLHLDADVAAGGTYHNDYCMVLTVRDGRIAAVREYMGDALHAIEALSL